MKTLRSPARSLSFLAACVGTLTIGCAPATPDAGPSDGGVDGGSADGGSADGGSADGGTDAGGDDAGTPLDAGPAPVLDAGPDNSLDGTPYAGIEVRWQRDLTLCNAWVEGGSLETERARKVRVRLPRQARLSLGEMHLGLSPLDGVELERGVRSDERFALPSGPETTTLTEWAVTPPLDNITFWQLQAVIEHDLGDTAGSIIERYDVITTEDGPQNDVVIGDPNSHGANFYYVPAGEDAANGIALTACDAPTETHLGVETLVGTIDTGPHAGRHVQVTRWWRTFDVFAGSYPVYWDATDVTFTDTPYEGIRLYGFWPQTYSAQHHNWEENSVLQPRLDPGAYHTLFAPLDRGDGRNGSAFSRVEWQNVTSFAQPGTMDVTLQDLQTGVETTHAVRLLSAFNPVDTHNLSRNPLLSSCADSEVKSLGSFAYGGLSDSGFQLLICPDASTLGFEILGVVPWAFSVDATVVGTVISGDAITPIADGYEINVGLGKIRVAAFDAQYLIVDVLDANGTSISSGLNQLTDLTSPVPADETLAGTADDVSLHLVRRFAGPGVGESVLFAPLSFRLSFGDEVHEVRGTDALNYTNSHHNWADSLIATDGDTEITWAVQFNNGPLVHTVSASRNGVSILEPTVIDVTVTQNQP